MRVIFRMEAANEPVTSIVDAVGLPPEVVSRVLRGDLAAGGEFSPPEDWDWDSKSDPHVDVNQFERTEAFERLLGLIPEKYREIAILFQHGYTPREIGMKLRMNPRKVSKIKQEMKTVLKRAGYDGPNAAAEGGGEL